VIRLMIDDPSPDTELPDLAPMDVCEVCGDTTETAPLCERHQREQDDEDAARAYREGRYE